MILLKEMIAKTPKVSVIMPVYKGEKYLRSAIDSILAQTFTDFELLIILNEDINSPDKSLEIMKSYSDQRIRLILNERKGLSIARNKGIEASRGEYIANLDCDDTSNPTRLQKQVDFLDSHPDFGLIGSFVERIDKNGQTTGNTWHFPALPEEVPIILFFGNYFAQSATMIRKSSLPQNGYDTNMPVAEDYNLWIHIAEKNKVWNLPEVLTQIRDHGENNTYIYMHLHPPITKKIYAYQLDKLDFQYSKDELENHYLFCVGKYEGSKENNMHMKVWLSKLYSANNISKAYDKIIFTKALLGRWYIFCKKNDIYWWLPDKIFWKTKFIFLNGLSLEEKITFIFKLFRQIMRKTRLLVKR